MGHGEGRVRRAALRVLADHDVGQPHGGQGVLDGNGVQDVARDPPARLTPVQDFGLLLDQDPDHGVAPAGDHHPAAGVPAEPLELLVDPQLVDAAGVPVGVGEVGAAHRADPAGEVGARRLVGHGHRPPLPLGRGGQNRDRSAVLAEGQQGDVVAGGFPDGRHRQLPSAGAEPDVVGRRTLDHVQGREHRPGCDQYGAARARGLSPPRDEDAPEGAVRSHRRPVPRAGR
ncbi:hypothetical protein ACTFBT_15660 [Streptomyces microflavus]|uniref:Uncharacterized protein n=1 Tax=Streptomyces microflavus TaxID=1919 RepID=A0A7J0CPZ3_STRMI|nr:MULTISPECIES: hypothetical protein [Streptomyces]MDX2981529.1 hypothetical protein [Streptomyces sp. NRRL_B-2249]GFN04571.1 hypothetical protein Smic_31270 [Streptomyces microflavus]GGX83941.1 hypothetical protein GCM10010298_56630 [Streptomyces microflavus]